MHRLWQNAKIHLGLRVVRGFQQGIFSPQSVVKELHVKHNPTCAGLIHFGYFVGQYLPVPRPTAMLG